MEITNRKVYLAAFSESKLFIYLK